MHDVRLRALILAGFVATTWPSERAAAQSTEPFVRSGSQAVASSRDVGVVRQRLVAVASPARLASPDGSQVLELDLFQDVRLRAHRTRLDAVTGGVTWTGGIEGYPGSSAVFATVDAAVVGHVSLPFGFFAVFRDQSGEYLVRQLDEGRRDPRPDDGVETPEPAVPASDVPLRVQTRVVEDTGALIDVMAVVSEEAVTGFGGRSNARASLELALAETNEAFRASRVSTAVRLVHVEYVDYKESKDSLVQLQQLQNPSDGVLDEMHGIRDRYGADLVVFVLEAPGPDAIGRAFFNSPGSRGAYGFSIVNRRELNEDRLLPHEIGHNLGLRHDWYVDASVGSALSFAKGVTSIPGRFLDIMSYTDLCRATNTDCSRVLAFSNPGLIHQGQPLGVPIGTSVACQLRVRPSVDCDADAAAALTLMAPVVARFRNSRAAVAVRRLRPGDAMRSPSGRFRLVYQVDGDLVLADDGLGRIEWSTNTGGTEAGEVAMTPDGDLAVVDAGGTVRWRSGTAGHPNAYFDVTDDGAVAVYRADGGLVWTSRSGAVPAGPTRDSVTVLSFSPTNGTVLQVGQAVEVTATARYELASASEASIWLQAQDDTGQSISPPVLTVPSTGRTMLVERGSGDVSFAMSFVVPGGISRITMYVSLFPAGQERSSAFVAYSFPVR